MENGKLKIKLGIPEVTFSEKEQKLIILLLLGIGVIHFFGWKVLLIALFYFLLFSKFPITLSSLKKWAGVIIAFFK